MNVTPDIPPLPIAKHRIELVTRGEPSVVSYSMRSTRALCCTACMTRLDPSPDGLTCPDCRAFVPQSEGIFDFLLTPTREVATELKGLAAENHVDIGAGLGSVKLMARPAEGPAELMARSRHKPVQYYQQTTSAYLEALARSQIDAGLDVLEIGSERTHHKLRMIKDLCSSAYALNIFFHVPQDVESRDFVTRVLADMSSQLPFLDESLDLVIVSASLHHAPNLTEALKEVARVLRRGGRAIVVNEPVEGAAKRLGSRLHHDRNSLIKEDPITWHAWKHAIEASGLGGDHFLPAWFIGRVKRFEALSPDTRFYSLAKAMRVIVGLPALGELARLVGRSPGSEFWVFR